MQPDVPRTSEYFVAHLRPSDISTAMVHLYRAEVTRANSWRSRLDVTTNWAVLSTGAAVSIAFSQQSTHHSVIILNTLLITLFLSIETRRYRYYELWSYRVRLMETDFYAALLEPPYRPDPDLADKLSESLLNPQFPISIWEAVGRRLRRNYIWVYLVLLSAWLAKLLLFPETLTTLDQLVTRAHMGAIPGGIVIGVVVVFYAALVAIAIGTRKLRQSAGEVFPRYGESKPAKKSAPSVDPQMQASAQAAKTYPFLAIVTADQLETVAAGIQVQFKRAPHKLDPNNTTGTQATLLIPVVITEIAALKTLVNQTDPKGVVTVIPAQEVIQQSAVIQKAAE
jgi:uncharacterized membrane protein